MNRLDIYVRAIDRIIADVENGVRRVARLAGDWVDSSRLQNAHKAGKVECAGGTERHIAE